MNKQNCTLTGIAKTMGKVKSTISREIKLGGNGYRAHRAVADGSLHRYLRHKGKKCRKRYGQNDYRVLAQSSNVPF